MRHPCWVITTSVLSYHYIHAELSPHPCWGITTSMLSYHHIRAQLSPHSCSVITIRAQLLPHPCSVITSSILSYTHVCPKSMLRYHHVCTQLSLHPCSIIVLQAAIFLVHSSSVKIEPRSRYLVEWVIIGSNKVSVHIDTTSNVRLVFKPGLCFGAHLLYMWYIDRL